MLQVRFMQCTRWNDLTAGTLPQTSTAPKPAPFLVEAVSQLAWMGFLRSQEIRGGKEFDPHF